VAQHHWVRRPLGALFWLAALVVPLGLAAFVGFTQAPTIQDNVQLRAERALHRAGLGQVRVVVDGRRVLARVPTGTREVKVRALLSTVPGVWLVGSVPMYASPAEARACAGLQKAIDRVTGRQSIRFVGVTSRLTSEGVRRVRAVGDLLSACPSAVVVAGGHSDSHTPDGSTLSLTRARVIAKVLASGGVDPARVTSRGYGAEFPAIEDASGAERQLNERGSITVEAR
jgi:outer membrane protein OmpA-like peptidoglycan-associated protein